MHHISTCAVVPCESSASTVAREVVWSHVEDTATIVSAGGRLTHADVRQVTRAVCAVEREARRASSEGETANCTETSKMIN